MLDIWIEPHFKKNTPKDFFLGWNYGKIFLEKNE